MELIGYSLSHKTLDHDALERLLEPSARDQLVSWASACEDFLESVVVSTCVRVEIYAVVADPDRAEGKLRDHVSLVTGLATDAVGIRRFTGAGAVDHLFRVTSGLESILWGETSVTHQVRAAYREASDRGHAGPLLHRLFHMAFRVSKRLRAEAGVASAWGSLPALAAERALRNDPATVLVVGAGNAGRAVLRDLCARGAVRVLIHGSRRDEVARLADETGAEAVAPSRLGRAVAEADAIITASGRGRIIGKRHLHHGRHVVIVDIGAPRNVHPGVREMPGVDLEDLSDLGRFAARRGADGAEGPWESILEQAVSQYEIWRRSRLGMPVARGAKGGGARRDDAGRVYLVGAGPGDPSLLTVKALRLLETADIVFYDALISPEILALIPAGIRRVPVGRRKGHTVCRQEEVHRGLMGWAARGASVVRLKGGDPSVFGRSAEEIEALRDAGVSVEIVPGITAASAAAAAASTSLTRRGVSASCAFVTGHGAPGSDDPIGDIADIARSVETLAIYMGSTRARQIASTLIEAGRDPGDGAAVVERASRSDQRVQTFTLGDLAWGEEREFTQPALILVGPTIEPAGSSADERVARAFAVTPSTLRAREA